MSKNYRKPKNYTKKYYKSKYRPRKLGRGAIYGTAGRQLLSDVMYLKKLAFNTEYKTYSWQWISTDAVGLSNSGLYVGGAAANQFPSIVSTALAQGTSAHQREGNSIKIKKVSISGSFLIAANVATVFRLLVINDKEGEYTGTQSWINVFDQNNAGETAPYMFKSKATATHSKILYDKTFVVNPKTAAGPTVVPFNIQLTPELHMKWDDAGNATQGVLRLMGVSDQPGSTNINIRANTRVSYVDN